MREVNRAGDQLTYGMGTFKIIASEFGVAFAGSSCNFKPDAMDDLIRFIRYANKAHKEIAAKRGVPLQEELDGTLRLRTREYGPGTYAAWYEGFHDKGVNGTTKDYAIKELRAVWRVIDHAKIAHTDKLQE